MQFVRSIKEKSKNPALQPATKDSVKLISELPYFPKNLTELYSKYNGVYDLSESDTIDDFCIAPLMGYWISIKNSIEEYNKLIELEKMAVEQFGESLLLNITKYNFFPFFYDGASAYLIVFKSLHSNDTILHYDFSQPDGPTIFYSSIDNFFDTLIMCFQQNVFPVKDGFWDYDSINMQKIYAICRVNNPDIEHWKET